MNRIGIVGVTPYKTEKWTFSFVRDHFIDLFQNTFPKPSSLASIGIGLSRMVDVYAKISRIPFICYRPRFSSSLPTYIAIAQRNHTFCSNIDRLIIFGETDHIILSIKEIASLRKLPVHYFPTMKPMKPCNSLDRESTELLRF